MVKITQALFCLCFLFCSIARAQDKRYWQQQVNYTIDVTLNDGLHTLDGKETFEYINNSSDTLPFIYIHLWPNAYSNDKTAFSKQLLKDRNVDFYFSNEDKRGHIEVKNIEVDEQEARLIIDSVNVDIAKLILPKPLLPKQKSIVRLSFEEKLPYNFSRGGYVGETFQVTQWYPKPAVYDQLGWHPMPYLEDGEYYSEFGNYNVKITVPKDYTVAASGKEIAPNEYQLNNAHDFAWFASRNFTVQQDTIQLPHKTISVSVYCEKDLKEDWTNALKYVKQGVHFYSKKIGEYPYDQVKIVSGPASSSNGGMEYPTIALIPANRKDTELETSIVHEVGHNWFYGALASNERDHAWMDEGMNSYYENKYTQAIHANDPDDANNKNWSKLPQGEQAFADLALRTLHQARRDQPIDLTASKYADINYGLSVYFKGSQWMESVASDYSRDSFDLMMHSYYNHWKFKHPYPSDFKQSMDAFTKVSDTDRYARLYSTDPIYWPVHKKLKPTFLFNLKETDKYNYLSFGPAIGYNKYDGAMVGAFIHNYQLPMHRFNFAVAPMYATDSKSFAGAGQLEYNTWHPTYFWQASLSAMTYHRNAWLNFYNNDYYARLIRIVPTLRLGLWNKDFTNTQRWYFTLRGVVLNEESFVANNTGTFDNPNYIVSKPKNTTTIIQLQAEVNDDRVLYPYSANLSIDEGKDFLRIGATGKYFFNYSGSKNNGIQARVFAGKFFYLTTKTFLKESELDRFKLSLSAPTGSYDYTYSNYFIGRSEYNGWMSQQTMERDGFMKVRTPYLSNPIGLSDDWIAALNLTADIPKTPLKLFMDFGTYSALWQDLPPTGRFLYDGGVEISLAHSLVNIYVPVIYNSVYRNDYKNKKNYFWSTISFNINLQLLDNFRRKKLWQ